jgi:hypothetical protein
MKLGSCVASAGDSDGDGGSDLLVAARGGGALFLYSGKSTRGARLHRRQLRPDGTTSVSVLGYSGRSASALLEVTYPVPAGATRLALEIQSREPGRAWSPDPTPFRGRRLDIDQRRGGTILTDTVSVPAHEFVPLEWRVRVRTDSPQRRTGRWYGYPGFSSGTGTVRGGIAPDLPPPPIDPPPDSNNEEFPFYLKPPYPNPSNPDVSIRYFLERAGQARVEVFTVTGARVVVLEDARREAGPHVVTWDGRGDDGRPVAAGVYFVRLLADGRGMTRKLVLVR